MMNIKQFYRILKILSKITGLDIATPEGKNQIISFAVFYISLNKFVIKISIY